MSNGIIDKISQKLGMLRQLRHANFSTTEKSYFLFMLNPSGTVKLMKSSCKEIKY
jgi:hypothetical protein